MNTFQLHNKVEKVLIKTKFGVVKISNIRFDSTQIQNMLPDLIFEDNNLKFMFQKNISSNFEKCLILNRFLPNEKIDDIDKFISNSIISNKTFYSFLAEGMLGIVFRDIFGYDLSVGIIDINETLNDTHTGADVCMFDEKEKVLIIGEAKFYESFKNGMNAIISDFLKKNILNKLDSYKRKAESNENSLKIILKNLKIDDYSLIPLNDFMNQKMIFAGFVLHSNEIKMDEYLNPYLYDKFNVSVDNLKNNIKKSISSDVTTSDYEIILLHLPINDKKTLIKEIIGRARLDLSLMKKGK